MELSERSDIVLRLIQRGHSYEQILSLHVDITYLDIFAAAGEALRLAEAVSQPGSEDSVPPLALSAPPDTCAPAAAQATRVPAGLPEVGYPGDIDAVLEPHVGRVAIAPLPIELREAAAEVLNLGEELFGSAIGEAGTTDPRASTDGEYLAEDAREAMGEFFTALRLLLRLEEAVGG